MGILNNGTLIAITTVLADLGIVLDVSDPSKPKIGNTFGVLQDAGTNPNFDNLAPGAYYYLQYVGSAPAYQGYGIFLNFSNMFQIRFRVAPTPGNPANNNTFQFFEMRGKTPSSGWQAWTDISGYLGTLFNMMRYEYLTTFQSDFLSKNSPYYANVSVTGRAMFLSTSSNSLPDLPQSILDYITANPGVILYLHLDEVYPQAAYTGTATHINNMKTQRLRVYSSTDTSESGSTKTFIDAFERFYSYVQGYDVWRTVPKARIITSISGASLTFDNTNLFANTTYNCTTSGITNMNISQYINSDDEIVINFTPDVTLVAGTTFIWNSSYFNKDSTIVFNAGEPYELNIRNGIMRVG